MTQIYTAQINDIAHKYEKLQVEKISQFSKVASILDFI